MKIGLKTNLYDKQGYGRWGDARYEKMREHGYSSMIYDLADTACPVYTLLREQSDEILLREKELCDKAEIEISQVHGPWGAPIRDSTEGDRQKKMEQMKKSIRAAWVLGCKNWVIHPLMPCGLSDLGTESEQTTWDINFSFMSELLQTAKSYGVTICLENMPFTSFSLSTPEKILRFVRAIDDEYFKICFDTGHVSVFGDLLPEDELRRLGKEIKVLHIHDNKERKDLHLFPYFGVIDWKSFARTLGEIGFEGNFDLETMPPKTLPDPIFEKMCKSLCEIAGDIIEYI